MKLKKGREWDSKKVAGMSNINGEYKKLWSWQFLQLHMMEQMFIPIFSLIQKLIQK